MRAKFATGGHRQCGPWFGWHPRLAVVLSALVVVLGAAAGGSTDGSVLLLTLPVALLALAFGTKAGMVAAVSGVGVAALTAATSGTSMDVLNGGTRTVPVLLWGGLLGTASDRLRRAADLHQRLALAHRRQREAAEVNDAIIQRLAVAKWSLEAGNDQRSLELLTETIHTAQTLVADLLREHGGDNDSQPPWSSPTQPPP